jgi:hypothetical protein
MSGDQWPGAGQVQGQVGLHRVLFHFVTAFVTSRHEFSGWPKNVGMKAAELNRRFNSSL